MRKRPTYPSASRQWQGLILVVLVIVLFEAISLNYARPRSPGGFLLITAIFVTYWSGLRQGLLASLISIVYLTFAYSIPGALFTYTPNSGSRILNAIVVYPLLVLFVGSMNGRLRNAAIREWDARERAETALAEKKNSEDMSMFVNESAMDAIVAIEKDGRISLWNPSAERIFGWTREEVIGTTLTETIIPSAHREAHDRGLARYKLTGEAVILGKRLELSGLAKDGREFPIEITIAKRDTVSGPFFIGFIRDITEQRKLNERLRQAHKMEAIGTLAGGIAHDFNNILTAISGNLVLAKQDVASDSSAQVSLTEIEKSVRRATYVVRQILTFSRSKDAEAEALNLAATLREAITLLKATLPTSMEIVESFSDELPTIVADSTDLHQIVLNLGINAQQALKGTAGKLEIQASAVILDEETAKTTMGVQPGPYVRISFRDNGCGMDNETLQRVFEPFFTTKGVGEGTGLGLAVVYGIVSRQGGAVTAYSEPRKGTVFHVYLRASDRAPTPPKEAIEEAKLGNGERILYIDDDEALVFMMKRMLSRLNYSVKGFIDPVEGLAAFKAEPNAFDLVITDMSMPQLSGPELVKELLKVRLDVPIVMVTGYIRPDDLKQARHIGVRELVLKPNSVEEMGKVLHRVISRGSREFHR